MNIARIWSLLVDTVSYTAWKAYKKENTKYLPQALEGIKEENIIIFVESAVETTFITRKEIEEMEQRLLSNFQLSADKTILKRDDFMNKLTSTIKNV